MASAGNRVDIVHQLDRLVDGLELPQGHHGGQLLLGHQILGAHIALFGHNEGAVIGDREARHLGDMLRRVDNAVNIQLAVLPDGIDQLFLLVGIAQIAAFLLQRLDHRVIHGILNGHRVLCGAAGAPVVGLCQHDAVSGLLQVRGVLHNGHGVARADAEGRRAGRVGCLDHCLAAGSDHIVRLLHQDIGARQRGILHALQQILGIAHAAQKLTQIVDDERGHLLGAGMGRIDHGVLGHQAENRLAGDQAAGDGHGHQRGDHAEGLCDLDQITLRILFDHTHGLDLIQLGSQAQGTGVVAGQLALQTAAVAVFLVQRLGPGFRAVAAQQRYRLGDLAHILLRQILDLSHGLSAAGDQLRNICFMIQCFHLSFLLDHRYFCFSSSAMMRCALFKIRPARSAIGASIILF